MALARRRPSQQLPTEPCGVRFLNLGRVVKKHINKTINEVSPANGKDHSLKFQHKESFQL